MEDFRIKYRPRQLSKLWGNNGVKSQWGKVLAAKKFPNAIVLYGNYGVGKTTLARIFAEDMLCALNNKVAICDGFHELDSTQLNAESVRRMLNEITSYRHGTMVLFFDELQRMAITTQEILLKPIEEAEDIFFISATTDLNRLDGGILSRSTKFILENPSKLVLVEKLAEIAQQENIRISKEALGYLVEVSNFSPRECLGNLQSLVGSSEYIEISVISEILKPI